MNSLHTLLLFIFDFFEKLSKKFLKKDEIMKEKRTFILLKVLHHQFQVEYEVLKISESIFCQKCASLRSLRQLSMQFDKVHHSAQPIDLIFIQETLIFSFFQKITED